MADDRNAIDHADYARRPAWTGSPRFDPHIDWARAVAVWAVRWAQPHRTDFVRVRDLGHAHRDQPADPAGRIGDLTPRNAPSRLRQERRGRKEYTGNKSPAS